MHFQRATFFRAGEIRISPWRTPLAPAGLFLNPQEWIARTEVSVHT